MSTRYDDIVIGAGQAGGPLSTALARAGRRVALVEREHVGGSCINEGCTPTKTMVASARVAYLARRAADYGVVTGGVRVDLARVRQRKRDIVESFRGGSQKRIEQVDGVDLLFGEARFTAPLTVEVALNDGGRRALTAERVFINVGTRAALPDLDGLADVPALDNRSIMELDTVPEHLIVIGGGYIGLEFGQMFRRFGSRVTIVHRGAQLLAREDDDVASAVADVLRDDGIELRLETIPRRIRGDDGGIELVVDREGREATIRGSHVLLATGRRSNADRLDLAAGGVAADARGFVTVNARLEASAPNVYAMGDVKGGPAFTHISYDDYRILRGNLIEGGSTSTSGRLVPYTVFIDPQLGRVGMSEREAQASGRRILVAKLPMTSVARAIEMDETRGFMKAVVDAGTGAILGAAVLGVEGGEVMATLQMAMMGGVGYQTIRDGVFAHPTLAESLNNLFMGM